MSRPGRVSALAVAAALSFMISEASARPPRADAAPHVATDDLLKRVQQAMEEQRFVDASRWLDEAMLTGAQDPKLWLARGELDLKRGRFVSAAENFRLAQASPSTRAAALEGEAIALLSAGQTQQAFSALQSAVAENPMAWRAWNALGSLHDQRQQWQEAQSAYDKALTASDNAAIVLNNRGYSLLLQGQREAAIRDFIAALKKQPTMVCARGNLRLALALGGDYERAIAGGSPKDQAALLNNAGFAATMRGDFDKATELLNSALRTRSSYYDRAAENLKFTSRLAAEQGSAIDAQP